MFIVAVVVINNVVAVVVINNEDSTVAVHEHRPALVSE